MTAAALAAEIDRLGAFFAAQQFAVSASALADMMTNHARALCAQIASLPSLDSEEGIVITNAVNAGRWSATDRAELASAISARVLQGPFVQASRKSMQSMMNIEKWLTAAD